MRGGSWVMVLQEGWGGGCVGVWGGGCLGGGCLCGCRSGGFTQAGTVVYTLNTPHACRVMTGTDEVWFVVWGGGETVEKGAQEADVSGG